MSKLLENSLFQDILLVVTTNGVVFTIANYGTPLVSFTTALLSLFYIIRKIKKEIYTKDKPIE